MSLATLKRNRKDFLTNIVSQAEKLNTTKVDYSDNRFWKPTRDAAGNGYAEIRFLPQREDEAVPFVRYWDHFFKGPTGQYYIEKSLTTFGEPDPVSELNSQLWNEDDNPNSLKKKQARDQKRKLHYVTNIYVVSDPKNPENNGKVFLYDFGKKIFDKITQAMNPEYEDETSMNPFDLWEGANFKLKVRQYEGWPNYDRSEFSATGPLADDEELEKIYSQVYSLKEFSDRSTFKSYDELKTRLNIVMGSNDNDVVRASMNESPAPSMNQSKSYDDLDDEIPYDKFSDGDDDTIDYFNKLLEED